MMTPLPRITHLPIGATVALPGYKKTKAIVDKCDYYAHFDDGSRWALSTVIDHPGLTFGDGRGWHLKESE